ncbi:protein kinase family protein [Trichocoleus sp. Lan]|uniref:protein kinase family protein n=1 Tax=Trichocoleus sp. Lan TaxID=2933927 RepID=UPI003297BB22
MINRPNFQLPKVFSPPKHGDVIQHNGYSYFIGKKIGQGSFGKVYECEDELGNELVAKVVVPKNQTYKEVQKHWLHELYNLVHLRHPNITYVYDAFECNNTFYLIIERCFGTLKELIELPQEDRNIWLPYVARDILQAVEFISSEGYVHKDIHPGNVFISQVKDKMIADKKPIYLFKIGDLGISRLESDINIFNTILAEWMLPPEFLNPEEFGRIGRQVDIYHTGLLLLSLILGNVPQFTHQEICEGRPRELGENINSPYGVAIAKALRRHVKDRTQTALEFWREISQASDL